MQHTINIPKGTSYSFAVRPVYDDGTVYPYNIADQVVFGVRLSPQSEGYVISKIAVYDSSTGSYVIALDPEDTSELAADERYWYDVGLETSTGDFYLLIDSSYFNVQKAITKAGMQT